jgi:hypothetical protein
MKKILVGMLAGLLVGCATTEQEFYSNHSPQSLSSLCRALQQTPNPKFRHDLTLELARRDRTPEDCTKRVATENVALASLAVVGAAVAIGVAANNGGFGGGSSYSTPRPYGAAWDQIASGYGTPIWRCRDRSNGRFIYDNYCSHLMKSDHTWPGLWA